MVNISPISQPVLEIEDRETYWHIKVLAPGYHKVEALTIDFTNNHEHAVKLGKERDAAGNSGVYAFGGFIPNERTWGAYVGETNNFTNRVRSHMSTKAAWFASLDSNTQWYLFAYPPNGNHWVKEDRTNIEDSLSRKIKETGGVTTTNQHNPNNYGQIGENALENITNDILYVIQRFTGWKTAHGVASSRVGLVRNVGARVSAGVVGRAGSRTGSETVAGGVATGGGVSGGSIMPPNTKSTQKPLNSVKETVTFYIKDKGEIIGEVLYDPNSTPAYTLLKGAKPRRYLSPSASDSIRDHWTKLQKKCVDGITTKDITYKTSSGLGAAVMGRSVNGKTALVDAKGMALKEYLRK